MFSLLYACLCIRVSRIRNQAEIGEEGAGEEDCELSRFGGDFKIIPFHFRALKRV